MNDAYVIGVGHTRFGEAWESSFRDLLTEAGMQAIEDAGVAGEDLDEVFVGSMSTGRLTGQEHVAPLLLDGAGLVGMHVPATRIEAAGASGAMAFRQGVQAIRSGSADLVVVGGIEKMTDVSDRQLQSISASGIDQEWEHFFGATEAALHALMAKMHMRQYGTTREQLAYVAVKNHEHASQNPVAQFQRPIKLEMVTEAPMVADPLTVFDCAPMTDGAACTILASETMAKRSERPIRVAGSGQGTDTIALGARDAITSSQATRSAAQRAYEQAGISAGDVDIAEVNDAYTISELLAIEDMGLIKKGESGPATLDGRTSFGGDIVVNPSGGLKARGHPAGATGVAQICELVWQLRGEAEARQVDGARIGIAHNSGGTGASAAVHVLEASQ